MSDSVWPHRRKPTRLPHPWDSPGKNAGVGCHFLLQCMKVKSESEVAQSCPTLSDPMDCSPPGSSIHGIFQARALEWGAIAFSGSWFVCSLLAYSLRFCMWVIALEISSHRRCLNGFFKDLTVYISFTSVWPENHFEVRFCVKYFQCESL